jgi:hypothetical protein
MFLFATSLFCLIKIEVATEKFNNGQNITIESKNITPGILKHNI